MNAPIVADMLMAELIKQSAFSPMWDSEENQTALREKLIAIIEHWEAASIGAGQLLMTRTKEAMHEVEKMKEQRGTIVQENFKKDEKIAALGRQLAEAQTESARLARELATRAPTIPIPIPIVITCPQCGERHIDEGEFATNPHHTHACQFCGLPWRPAIQPTIGVQFLPGFKNEPTKG